MSLRLALLTTNLAPGGAETQVVRLAVEMRRRGWRVAVVSLLPPSAFITELEDAGVEVHSADMRPGAAELRGLARVVAILARFRPQVVHSHMFHANVAARVARLVCPVPALVATLHSAAESRRRGGGLRARDLVYRFTRPLGDAVVAVSRAAGERHVAAGAVSRRKLRVIPNGVDTSVFRPDAERRSATRRSLGLKDGEFAWLAAGRLMWKKDYPTLLEAFAAVRGGVLLIAGEGPREAGLRALAVELNVNARFLGRRDDLPALMNAADAFVLSSVVEGLPVVLLEAAASGLPAVTTDAGGSPEVVEEGRTGWVVPCGNVKALAAAMSRLAGLPPEERERMGLASRERALAEFEFAAVAARWERLYRELLEARGAALWT